MIGKEFRFPTKEAREKMTVEELEKCLDLSWEWYLMNEEEMTLNQIDKFSKKGLEFQRYVEQRNNKNYTFV